VSKYYCRETGYMKYVAGAMGPTNIGGGGDYYIYRRVSKNYCRETGYTKYVAGAMGPTNRTLSISPSVEKPEFRNISE